MREILLNALMFENITMCVFDTLFLASKYDSIFFNVIITLLDQIRSYFHRIVINLTIFTARLTYFFTNHVYINARHKCKSINFKDNNIFDY